MAPAILADLDSAGSTFIGIVERYGQRLQEGSGKLILADVHDRLSRQLELTKIAESIVPNDMFLAESQLGEYTTRALDVAHDWLH